jgi:hypothetical protein
MMRHDKPSQSPAPGHSSSPGRLRTFIVTLLGTLLGGLTVIAVSDSAPWERTPADTAKAATAPAATETVNTSAPERAGKNAALPSLTRDQLNRLGWISLGLAILSLLLPRSTPVDPRQLTPQLVAEATGLTVVGSLFNTPKRRKRSTGRILQAWVGTAECTVFAAIALTVTAYVLHPEVLTTLRKNPLVGYMHAIQQVTDTVAGWVIPRLPIA